MKLLQRFGELFENFEKNFRRKKMAARYKSALAKTQREIADNFLALKTNEKKIGANFYRELEEVLISADIDYTYTVQIVQKVRKRLKKTKVFYRSDAIEIIINEILLMFVRLQELNYQINLRPIKQISCILFCGVNGGGKTTTIVKLAHLLKTQYRRKVMMIAADTFRSGAIAQLAILAKKNRIPIYIDHHNKRPDSVVYRGIKVAKEKSCDVVLIDTSGRLHNNQNLLLELKKVTKSAEKSLGYSLAERFLIIDATNGQVATQQLEMFNKFIGITGLILTKLDSSSHGGTILSLMDTYQIPTKFIGTGENKTDFEVFDFAIFLYNILKFIKI